MPANSTRRQVLVISALLVLMLLAVAVRVCVPDMPPEDMFWQFVQLRQTRVALAVIVGAALAISGVALQALLRNPLAEPYILGLSSGAALGVMAQLSIGYALDRMVGPTHFGALLGAMLCMGIVYIAGRKRGVIDPLGLLLVGVVLSAINASLIMLLNYIWGPAGMREDVGRWMMGYLDERVSREGIQVIAVMTLAGLALLVRLGRAMDAASFSDAESQSMGVNIRLLRAVLFVVASVLAAGAVVLGGPIAFVGLICPHVVRLLLGPGHRALLIGSALAGATLILAADIASVVLDFGQGRLPVGIFIAMLGGVVFLWILRSQMGRGLE